MYQQTLLLIMEINNYSFIPDYPFEKSLDELENTKEVEQFCYNILKKLQTLIDKNK